MNDNNTMNTICSIYLLTNTVNGKCYVGQTWLSLNKRMGGKNGGNYKHSIYLYNALQKYGTEKFKYTVLAQCSDQSLADELEKDFITQYNSMDPQFGYNIKAGGSAGKHSEETKAKISKAINSYLDSLSPKLLAQRVEPIVQYWTGKEREPQSPEIIQHHSEVMKEWHANNVHPMLGKTHTDEAKEKMSKAGKGHAVSDKTRKAISAAHKMTPEREQELLQAYQSGLTIDAIEEKFNTGRSSIYRVLKRNNISRERDRKQWLGKKHSDATIQKMAEARKNYWAEKNNTK